ncbi:hypothetical protein [Paracoccus yeei]|uniref:hypothetical protein n=1 Tax=Paracoccus yeei TaxID=147645 RepID=UPI0017489431|nr:hypothetical protein [Paracoccus yeei]
MPLDEPVTLYRGIAIRRSEIPGSPFTWLHDEGDAGGHASSEQQAKAQIDAHLARALISTHDRQVSQ